MTINFDMDGTIADLYGVENWLPDLRSENPRPYAVAQPLLPMAILMALLIEVKAQGHKVNVLSWSSKNASTAYDKEVEKAKRAWLAEHLPQFNFDNIFVVPYGTPKSSLASGLLFDDDERVRKEWEQTDGNKAVAPSEILDILSALLKKGA